MRIAPLLLFATLLSFGCTSLAPESVQDVEREQHLAHSRILRAADLVISALSKGYLQYGQEVADRNLSEDMSDPANTKVIDGKRYITPEMATILTNDRQDYLKRVQSTLDTLLSKWAEVKTGNEEAYTQFREWLIQKWYNKPGVNIDGQKKP